MSLIIGAVVIIVIIAGAAFFMSGRSSEKNTTNTTQNKTPRQTLEKMEEVSVSQESEQEVKENNEERAGIAHQEKSTATVVENKVRKEEKEEKAQLYRYLNHELQNLFDAYNKGEWDKVVPGEVPAALYKEKDEIITKLSSVTGKMVEEYFSCIDFREEEGKFSGRIKDREKLKKVFLQFMMPFYPYYYKELSEGGLRHTALLHPNTLRLFQQLTGKKFRPGYRNRYTTGVRAFEWDKDRYKVYRKDGRLLCDAIFSTDGIIEGYGQKAYIDKVHPDWNIVEEGNWKDGVFQGEILRYEYKKTVK